jgi:hypothetical protein
MRVHLNRNTALPNRRMAPPKPPVRGGGAARPSFYASFLFVERVRARRRSAYGERT